MVLNLGGIRDVTFQVSNGKLQSTQFNSDTPGPDGAQDLQYNVVNLKALYGKDTLSASGSPTRAVDTYTDQAPTAAEWQDRRVVGVRVAILVRSSQYIRDLNDKSEGTLTSNSDANFYWHIGSVGAPAGAIDCPDGSGKCILLKHDFSTDWQHYRYKLFEVVVPLRNAVWYS
jgi:type IV pilus assembly protein PilW